MPGTGRVLKLPEDARGLLSGAHGPIVQPSDLDRSKAIITVGDVCSAKCIEAGIRPDLVIVDMKTKRGAFEHGKVPEGYHCIRVKNPAGHLTPELFEAITKAELDSRSGVKTYMTIEGEEDLSTIPLILAFPEGTQIVYGVPDVGMAMLIITREFRERAQRLIESMR
jgi:uncharacterized protein (UPF0218 family)